MIFGLFISCLILYSRVDVCFRNSLRRCYKQQESALVFKTSLADKNVTSSLATAAAITAAITAATSDATSAAIPGGIAAAIQQQSQSRPQSQPQPHSAIMDKHLTSVSFHFLSNIYNKFFTDPELKTLIYRVLDIQLKKQ